MEAASISKDEISIKLFNLPIEDHSKGILDRLRQWSLLEQSFRVIERQSSCVRNFGLLIIELYTIPPSVMVANYGKTAATVYDATHGFRSIYLEIPVCINWLLRSGLHRNLQL
jgi:hypothetical protein